MLYMKETVNVPAHIAALYENWCKYNPKNYEDYLNRCLEAEESYGITVHFQDNYTMHILCCGVDFTQNKSNTAYTKATLYDQYGRKISESEKMDSLLNEWEITNTKSNTTYIAQIRQNTNVKNNKTEICA